MSAPAVTPVPAQDASLHSSRRLLRLTVAVAVVALLLLARYHRRVDTATLKTVTLGLLQPAGVDSTYYMEAALDSFDATHSIYPEVFFQRHLTFLYPPSSLFLTQALRGIARAGLSPRVLWKAVLLLAWAGVLLLAVRFFRELRAPAPTTPLEAACIVFLAVAFLPIAEALLRGQVQLVLALLWGIAALAWHRGHRGLPALCLALTCIFKPQLSLFLLWAVLRRQWRFFTVFAVLLAVVELAALAVFGLRNHLDYLAVLQYLSRHGEAYWPNQSINGVLQRALHNGDVRLLQSHFYPPYRRGIYVATLLFQAVGLAVALLLPWRRRWAGATADLLFFGAISTITSPIVWEHHYSYFFFLVLYLLARANSWPRGIWLLLCGCLLAMSNRLPPLDALATSRHFNLLSSYLFYAGLVVLALLAWQAQRDASPDILASTRA